MRRVDRPPRSLLLLISIAVLACVAPTAVAAPEADPAPAAVKVLYMAQAGYQPQDVADRAEAYGEARGRRVEVSFLEYEDMYAAIVASSAASSPAYDVVLTDLIWVADFARRGIVDPVPGRLADEVRSGVAPVVTEAFVHEGRLWAHPFLANMQLLYANRDLLGQVGLKGLPRTLEEVVKASQTVRSRGLLRYPLFDSWRKQEALVCEFTWVVGAFGGTLSAPDGSIRVDSQACVEALVFMRDLLARGLMNPYSLRSDELFASEVFLNGDAAFTTNWTYLLGRMREMPYAQRRLTALPIPASERRGGGVATVSGFQGLSVLSGSRLKAQAWDLVRFLASRDFQREHLSELPVWRSLWQDWRVREADPFLGVKLEQLAGVYHRPQHPRYREASAALQTALADALAGRIEPEASLRAAQMLIEELGR